MFSFATQSLEKKKKTKRRKKKRMRKEADLFGTSQLAGSERLVRLINAFVKGRRLESGEAPQHGVAPHGA